MTTTATRATCDQIRELAAAIASQAAAISNGTTTGSAHSAALLLADNVDTLRIWTEPMVQ